MPRCGCQDSCSCLITAGPGVTVEGIGTLERPYEISADTGELEGRVVFTDDGSVDFTATGQGSVLNPLVVFGDVALTALSDVPVTPPASGNILVWRTDHWAYENPAAVAIPVSGVWGTAPLDTPTYGADSLIGREIYTDSAGKLRTRPEQLTGLIAQFPVTALPTVYPPGTSVMYVSTADGVAWPTTRSCIVTTSKTSNSAAQQWCAEPGTTISRVWFRNGQSSGWGPWVQVANSAPNRVTRLKSVVQTLTTASTYYNLTYETTEEADSGITYAAGVFTFTVGGVYQVNAVQHFASLTGDPQLRLGFMVNGVNYGYAVSGGTSASNSQSLALSRSWRFAAGDTLSIQAFSTQAAQNAYGSASARYSFIDITRIAA